MKMFINSPDTVVDEMVEGFLLVHGERVRRLESSRVLVRKDAPVKGKVGIVTGGGSGHKPAFIGFLGRGMLDAVAVGEIFTAPPAQACIEAARAVDGGAGVLFLLGNYSGDVMNFRLAEQTMRSAGVPTRSVIATDDVASGSKGEESKRRGVVGEWFAWKCCGAAAEAGASLDEVAQVAIDVNERVRTMGVASEACIIPSTGKPTFQLGEDEMELGVGHHGEPGVERIRMMGAREVAQALTERLVEDLPFRMGDEVAVMINGLGSTTQLEQYVVFKEVHRYLSGKGIRVIRSYVGEYFTGLDMAGLSVTLFNLNDKLIKLLDAPANTPAYTRT